MPSRRKVAPIVGKEGLKGRSGSAARREQDVAAVEIDARFGRMLGLVEGQKVGAEQGRSRGLD